MILFLRQYHADALPVIVMPPQHFKLVRLRPAPYAPSPDQHCAQAHATPLGERGKVRRRCLDFGGAGGDQGSALAGLPLAGLSGIKLPGSDAAGGVAGLVASLSAGPADGTGADCSSWPPACQAALSAARASSGDASLSTSVLDLTSLHPPQSSGHFVGGRASGEQPAAEHNARCAPVICPPALLYCQHVLQMAACAARLLTGAWLQHREQAARLSV